MNSTARGLSGRNIVGSALMLITSIAIVAGAFVFRAQLAQFSTLGYVGVFLISLIGNATLFLPAPSYLVVISLGGVYHPIVLGLVAGLGAALGELTGYLLGRSGHTLVAYSSSNQRVQAWVTHFGPLAIFLLAAIPNPLFDVGGVVAGVIKMPLWQFVLATWLGKSVRMIILALSGVLLWS